MNRELLASEADLTDCSLLYCAPEALVMFRWREMLEKPGISSRVVAVVVDKAHSVSQW